MQAFDSTPPYFKSELLAQISGLKHGFFGSRGGVSKGFYSSLNCRALSHDKLELVATNRAIVASTFGVESSDLFSCNQCHSNKVLVVEDRQDIMTPFQRGEMVTKLSGITMSTLGADCAPVLFSAPVSRVIGTAHY